MDVKDKIDSLLESACTLAVNEVERLARAELKRNPKLTTFTMAMGSYFFIGEIEYSDEDDILHDYEAKELDDFIAEYDKDLCMTGCPMHFTATGEKITQW